MQEKESARRLTRRGFIFGSAAATADAVWELSGRAGIVRRTWSLLRGDEVAAWKDSRSVLFTRPKDRGYGGFDLEDVELLGRLYPDIRPDLLKPQLASGYRSKDNFRNFYYQYAKDPYFSSDSLFNAIALDKAFRQNTEQIKGKIKGVSFLARLKQETGSCVLIVPSHFPMPDGQSSSTLLEETEWTHKADPKTGDFFAVIRAHGNDKVARGMSVNKVFGAISAAKSIEIIGRKKPLSKALQKRILEAVGEVPLARFLGTPYEEFAEMVKEKFGWAPSEEYYSSMPGNLKPVFEIY